MTASHHPRPSKRSLTRGVAASALALPLLAGGSAWAATANDEPPPVAVVDQDRAEADVNAWYGSGYSYEQLMAVAGEWNLGQFEAKARAARSIEAGDTTEIDAILAAARPLPAPVASDGAGGTADNVGDNAGDGEDGFMGPVDPELAAAFWDTGYSYEQLLVLADDWGVQEFEAKMTAGRMILDGDQDQVDALLGLS